VNPDWAYGLPELSERHREAVRTARLVSNPGCYPTGFLLAVRPLVAAGLLDPGIILTICAVSGYTGGGRQMVERYEARAERDPTNLWYSRPYALGMNHKHVPEMKHHAGLDHAPLFLPSVGHFPQGMLVSVPLSFDWLKANTTLADLAGTLATAYEREPCVRVFEPNDETTLEYGQLSPVENVGTNLVDLLVFGNDQQAVLIARLDNLGKGAGGAAVQNLNLMLGLEELTGPHATN